MANDSNKFEKFSLSGPWVQVDRKNSAEDFVALAEQLLFDFPSTFFGGFVISIVVLLLRSLRNFSDADGPAKADQFIFRLFSFPSTQNFVERGGVGDAIENLKDDEDLRVCVCFNVVYRRLTLHRTENARTDTEDFKEAKKKRRKLRNEGGKKEEKKTWPVFLSSSHFISSDTPIFYQLVLSFLFCFLSSLLCCIRVDNSKIFFGRNIRRSFEKTLEQFQNEDDHSSPLPLWLPLYYT